MSRNRNDELPDDLIDKLKLLNEQPDDYDADTRPLVPLNEGLRFASVMSPANR